MSSRNLSDDNISGEMCPECVLSVSRTHLECTLSVPRVCPTDYRLALLADYRFALLSDYCVGLIPPATEVPLVVVCPPGVESIALSLSTT